MKSVSRQNGGEARPQGIQRLGDRENATTRDLERVIGAGADIIECLTTLKMAYPVVVEVD